MKLEYLGTDIEELSMRKNISDDIEIELQTNTNYTVYFSEDGESCIGEFEVEIVSQFDPDQLMISYRSKSFFNIYDVLYFDKNVEREIHTDVFDRIFPLCNETLRQFTSMAGIPNISLVDMNVGNMEIVSDTTPQFSM